MGCQLGVMVRKGELTYKYSEINSSQVCNSNIHKRTIKYSNSLADRQQDYLLKMRRTHNREHLIISKSNWSYLLSKQTAMSAEYLPSALNVHADWESRNAKDNLEWKLDVTVFQETVTHIGQPTLDLFVSLTHCMETRPRQCSNRCIPSSLGQGIQFCFSSIQLDQSGSTEDLPRENKPSNHSDVRMANSVLVCTISKNVCTATISSALDKKFVNNSTRQKSSSSRNKVTGIRGVEGFQQSLQMEGYSSNAAKLISHSRRKSSRTNYKSAWDQRTSWCNERQVNPFQKPVNYIINFLSEKFDKGLKYRTLNCLRWTISAYHLHIDGKSLRKHPKFCALLAIIFNQRPPQPKYVFI